MRPGAGNAPANADPAAINGPAAAAAAVAVSVTAKCGSRRKCKRRGAAGTAARRRLRLEAGFTYPTTRPAATPTGGLNGGWPAAESKTQNENETPAGNAKIK